MIYNTEKNTLHIWNLLRVSQENFWVIILWIAIFMIVLGWDQEKIVLLNLVLFLYLVYFGVSPKFEVTFEARQKQVLDNLTGDLNSRVVSIKKSLTRTVDFVFLLNSVVLILISSNIRMSSSTIFGDLSEATYLSQSVAGNFGTIDLYFASLVARLDIMETGKGAITASYATKSGS